MKKRILHILIALDQLIWVLISLGKAHPDETISAASWRLELRGKWLGKILRPIIDTLFFFDKNHCQRSYESELARSHLPRIYREWETNNQPETTP
ncbi:MAG: hypothetical protein LV471_11135 [Nitrosomonas sp.]|nr:hypothetical protein [Nitrosomonas sp.]